MPTSALLAATQTYQTTPLPNSTPAIQLRIATANDTAWIMDSLAKEWRPTWEVQSANTGVCAIAYIDWPTKENTRIGRARLVPLNENSKNQLVLKSVWIDPQARGHHLGLALIEKLLAHVPSETQVFLTCEPSFIGYYQKIGFTVVPPVSTILHPLKQSLKERGKLKPGTCMEESWVCMKKVV